MEKEQLIGERFPIYQDWMIGQNTLEGWATVRAVHSLSSAFIDGQEHYEAYTDVEFDDEKGRTYSRWIKIEKIKKL